MYSNIPSYYKTFHYRPWRNVLTRLYPNTPNILKVSCTTLVLLFGFVVFLYYVSIKSCKICRLFFLYLPVLFCFSFSVWNYYEKYVQSGRDYERLRIKKYFMLHKVLFFFYIFCISFSVWFNHLKMQCNILLLRLPMLLLVKIQFVYILLELLFFFNNIILCV